MTMASVRIAGALASTLVLATGFALAAAGSGGRLVRLSAPRPATAGIGVESTVSALEPALAVVLTTGEIALVSAEGELIRTLGSPNSTPNNPARALAWSPAGSELAFARGGDIYAVEVATGLERRLTTAGDSGVTAFDGGPAWSSDGRVIAYIRHTDRGNDIWLVPATGGVARALTNDGSFDGVQWQPGGRLLLAYSSRVGGRVIDAASGSERALDFRGAADWSPDGEQIAFVAGQSLEVVRADGTGRRILHTFPVGSSEVCRSGVEEGTISRVPGDIRWSPDGRRIAIVILRQWTAYPPPYESPPSFSDVYAVDSSGRSVHRLTGRSDCGFPPSTAGSPRWWADGSRLLFARLWPVLDIKAHIGVMNADGTCEQDFAPEVAASGMPVWNPVARPMLSELECVEEQVWSELEIRAGPFGLRSGVPFTVVATNDGTLPLANARVRISASRGLVRGDSSFVCSRGSQIVCELGTLSRGAQARLSVVGVVSTSGPVTYTANISSSPFPYAPSELDATRRVFVHPCDLLGTQSGDRLTGSKKRDRICGFGGADRIDGRGGDDRIDGGSGSDVITGGRGNDDVRGSSGNDTINVRDGERDALDCGAGRDVAVTDKHDRAVHCERVRR